MEESDETPDKKLKKKEGGKKRLTKVSAKVIQESESEGEQEYYSKLTIRPDNWRKLGLEWMFCPDEQRYFLPRDFSVPGKLFDNLFDHQKVGIQWLYNLWRENKGGVLGDDMGLGKTVQVSVYLKGLFDAELIKKVLIVVPATMKTYWEEELHKWCYDCPNITQFDDKKKANRYDQMKLIRKKGGILVTSYSMVTTERMNLSDMSYDLIIVDEGHKAKNKNTQFRRDITSLRVKGHRIILSGTPLQNNLSELWSVFDFVQPKIFGSYERFQREYQGIIEKGLVKDSSQHQKAIAQRLSQQLRLKYQDHFLRRTKDKIFSIVCAETLNRPMRISELPIKTDLVVWMPLTQAQKQIYKYMLQNQDLQRLIKDREIKNALFILAYIKKLTLHPYLLSTSSLQRKKDIGIISKEEEMILNEQLRIQDEEIKEQVGI